MIKRNAPFARGIRNLVTRIALVGVTCGVQVASTDRSAVSQTSEQSVTRDSTSDVHVRLVLADKKTTFRIGEPIKLAMEFTADVDGFHADTIPERGEQISDTISIYPDAGINYWRDVMNGGLRYGRDVFSEVKLSKTPAVVDLTLNDMVRFDTSGHYKVSVTTKRASPQNRSRAITLTTNTVEFDIKPMSADEEVQEVKRISTLLDAARDLRTKEALGQELSYLTGDPSTREKVRRFLLPEDGGNMSGLYIARNRKLVLQLLESAMRDPNQPVYSSLLHTVSNVRLLIENSGVTPEPRVVSAFISTENPRMRAIQNAYLTELALGLNKRTGKSLTAAAITIMTSSQKGDESATTFIREARRVLVQQFDSLYPFEKEYLLQSYWDELRDISLVGPLKKMLSYRGTASRNIHNEALTRLLEIAPGEARPYVIAEIRDPNSLVDLEILKSLPDESLPEVDDPLLEQIRRTTGLTSNFAPISLKQKASLAVRYASERIYPEIMTLYQENASKLQIESRAVLLAYLAKHNERDAIPLIEQTLAEIPPEQEFNFLPELTKLYYSEGIKTVLQKRLDLNEPHAASNAAYLIGKHGFAGDELLLQARLERWRKEWLDRSAEADANGQGMIERELIYAMLNGKSWKFSRERVNEVKQSCVTKMCRQSIR